MAEANAPQSESRPPGNAGRSPWTTSEEKIIPHFPNLPFYEGIIPTGNLLQQELGDKPKWNLKTSSINPPGRD